MKLKHVLPYLRFSLWRFLISVVVFLVVVGFYTNACKQQHEAVQWVKANGGKVGFSQDDPPSLLSAIYGVEGVSTVTFVELPPDQIRNPLAHVARFPRLEVLTVRAPVEDISKLQALRRLKALYITVTPDVDLSPIVALDSLISLNLSHSKFSDVSLLSASNVRGLVLRDTNVRDLSFTLKMPHLEYLDVSETNADLSPTFLKAATDRGIEVVTKTPHVNGVRARIASPR